ncbi:MAG: hypothetical protein Q8J78_03490 [Moraxellaceae bacterium]|nr:hypothetical protein [Moraxellaceae bacterium]
MHAFRFLHPGFFRHLPSRLLLALLLWLFALGTQAATITQSFMTNSAPGWVFGGSAILTSGGADPANNGWLRLTSATTNQAGFAYYNTAYTTANGFLIEFDYGSWGGTSADGFTLFLFDGATPTFNIGDFGGSLGYANGCSPAPGLSRAYIGIAFDEYGNFTNPADRCKNGGPGQRANSVTLRGEGNGVDNGTNYAYLTHNQLPVATQRIDCPNSVAGCTSATVRPTTAVYSRRVRVLMYPSGGSYVVQVEMQFVDGDPYDTVISTYTLPTPIYPTLKIGFAGATGGSTNNHELRNLTIDVFDALADKQATGGFNGTLFAGSQIPYQVNVTNNGFNTETGPITVSSTLPASLGYAGFVPSGSWSCSNAGQLVTCTHPGPLGVGASLAQLTLNLNIAPAAAGTTITNNATVSGAVFDHISSNNTVTSSRFVYGASASGVKSLYMYFNSAGGGNANTLRRIVPASDSLSGDIAQNAYTPWMPLTPATVRPLTISAGTIQIPVCLARTGSGTLNRNVRVELATVGSTVTTLGAQTISNAFTPNDAAWRTITFTIPIAAAVNLAAGTQIRVRLQNLSTSSTRLIAARSFVAACGTGYSRADITTSTVINVDSVGVYSAAYPGGTLVSSFVYDNGTTLWLRSVVSDPFGSFDITGADYRLFDSSNTQVGGTVALTQVNDNVAAGQRTYQTSFVTPTWTGSTYSLQVTGKEGTEGTVTHVSAGSLQVRPLPPMLSVTKLASQSNAAPGTDITYTVQMSNTGTGNAIDVILADDTSPFTAFKLDTYGAGVHIQFVDGSPASGLTMGIPQYSNDNGSTFTYTPTSGGGGASVGYDANVTNIRIPLSGSMPPTRNFSVNYALRIR